MSIFDTTLHIPAEPRPFMPARATTRVSLPLEARPGGRFAIAGFGAAAMAAACFGLAVVLAGAEGDPPSRLAFAAVFLVAGAVPAAVAATAVRDAWRAGPVLRIDSEGMVDTRLEAARIPWEDVVAASIVGTSTGIAAVRLRFARERSPRYNPFRLGGWSAEWGPRRRERLVALSLLDRRPHDLAHTIVTLAARRGATIERDALPPWL